MKSNIITFLSVLIALSLVGQSLACDMKKQNKTSRAKRDMSDMVVQGVATAVGVIQQGAAIKGNWSVKSGDKEMGHSYKAGTGDAMKDEEPSSERRKRSTENEKVAFKHGNVMREDRKSGVVREKRSSHPKFMPVEMVKSLADTLLRSKRQTDGQQMPGISGGTSGSFVDSMKKIFNSAIALGKQLFATVQQHFKGQQDGQKGNAETMQ
ncbi:uncharacterized protein LOC129572186 [Sitodiplosis mosellana]|uniref:uncharacterized protein LOC129572186 n=1 Tax=Sitodiplosis mosellana TaxID=263140 RepID=UPI002443B130|nr:uncharacterized protein LOC129572186 [Sitodiplosis mosellana]